MSTVTVQSPVPGYSGSVIGVSFSDGKASVDRSNADALSYFRRHGYGLDAPTAPLPEPPDPREVGEDGSGVVTVGTKLRDAAVDPEPSDFLPPTNAGQENPHGPKVVSPGIHAVPPAPIVPGPVSSRPATQEAAETAAALEALAPADWPRAPEPVAEPEPPKPSRSATKKRGA